MLDPETCWVADSGPGDTGGVRPGAGGGWRAAELMTSVYIILWSLSLARPPRRKLMMPHDHGVYNWSLTFYRNGRQLDLGESRSPTQVFQRNLLRVSLPLWAYLCAFRTEGDDGDGDDGDGDDGDDVDGDDGHSDDNGVGSGDHCIRST